MSFFDHNPRRIAWFVTILGALFVLNIMGQTNTTRRPAKGKQKQESFTRPKPTRPIKPEVPSQDRYVTNKVFLEQADSLRHNNSVNDAQIVTGNVRFRQGNMFLYCDSAYYYSEDNSLDAFGHVHMVRGDTLNVYADKVFYDGMQKLARLRHGPTEPKVRVKNRDVTLTADSLFYSMAIDRGWYDCSGRLEDNVNVLTSQYGEYSPATKTAEFFHDVVLKGKKNNNSLYTDTLYYNTATHLAQIVSPTRIYSDNDTILTSSGNYNTNTGEARLDARSLVTHRDSNNNVTTLEGDSILYDKVTSISRAFMFRDPSKMAKPMVITDTARKVTLIGMYGEYNDRTRQAFSTGLPMLIEYSRNDSNFLRADTIRTKVVSRPEPAPYTAEQLQILDSLKMLQATLDAEADSLDMLALSDLQLKADTIQGGNTSVINLEEKPTSELEQAFHVDIRPGEERRGEPLIDIKNKEGLPPDSLWKHPRRNLIAEDPRLARDTIMKEYNEAYAIGHARFFNQQLQAIADTMIFFQQDSLLHMRRKPIVWNEERQVKGDTIIVHFNDSTVDRARVVNGFVVEHIDEDFYNQLKGKKMHAFFENKDLRRLEVDDNVEAIMLPQEDDSTYNKVIQAESEHLTMDMADKDLKKLKMWSAVDGTVTPIFVMKQAPYLQGFSWDIALRPRREWYEGKWRWDDDLGDISDELEEYFRQ